MIQSDVLMLDFRNSTPLPWIPMIQEFCPATFMWNNTIVVASANTPTLEAPALLHLTNSSSPLCAGTTIQKAGFFTSFTCLLFYIFIQQYGTGICPAG